ncbi:MAG: hypothetical protein J6M31_07140 [Bacteroidales bacterium]|nr:hypothetical protein [Bacteroidales bacterium]
MKKLAYFAMALFAVACTQKLDMDIDTFDGKGLEFLHFSSASDSWLVAEDDESYVYDVTIANTYTHDAAVTYNVAVGKKTTGVEGVDFAIPTKSVTIEAGKYLGTLPVEILYDTTGEGFVLEIELSVDDALINPSYGKSALITVKSDKITIDWDWLVGNWTEQDISGDPYPMAISQQDETTAVFTNIWGMESDLVGTVDFDARTVTFKGPASLGEAYGGQLMISHLGADGYDDGDIVATLSPLGIVIADIGFYLSGGSNDGYDFGEDYITLTR